jgi:hypothetical protein
MCRAGGLNKRQSFTLWREFSNTLGDFLAAYSDNVSGSSVDYLYQPEYFLKNVTVEVRHHSPREPPGVGAGLQPPVTIAHISHEPSGRKGVRRRGRIDAQSGPACPCVATQRCAATGQPYVDGENDQDGLRRPV